MEVLDRSGLSPRGHSGKDLLQILETYPRDELFQIKTDDLYEAVVGVLRMAGRRQLRLFLRRDGYGRFISCLIYLPRDRFTTGNRLSMQEILLRELNGIGVDYTTRVTERMLARVHFIVRTDPADPPGAVDPNELAEMLADATRMWDDDFSLVLERKLGEEPAKDLFTRYAAAFPDSYKDGHTPYEGMQDLAKLELLEEAGQLEMHLYRKRHLTTGGAAEPDDADVRFKVYRYGEPMMLSAVLPVLHSLGRPGRRRAAVRDPPHRRHRLPVRLRPAAAGRAPRAGRGPPAGGERVRGGLAGRGRGGRLQRAGAAGRADLAAGGGAAGVREVSAAGRQRLLPALRGVDLHRLPGDRPAAGAALRDPVLAAAAARRAGARPARRRAGRADHRRCSTAWTASTRTGSCGRT